MNCENLPQNGKARSNVFRYFLKLFWDSMLLWWPSKNCYSLSDKFSLNRYAHQTYFTMYCEDQPKNGKARFNVFRYFLKLQKIMDSSLFWDCMFLWWPSKNCYSLSDKFSLNRFVHQTYFTMNCEDKPKNGKARFNVFRYFLKLQIIMTSSLFWDCMFLWWSGKNCYSLSDKFSLNRFVHQTLLLEFTIYSCF